MRCDSATDVVTPDATIPFATGNSSRAQNTGASRGQVCFSATAECQKVVSGFYVLLFDLSSDRIRHPFRQTAKPMPNMEYERSDCVFLCRRPPGLSPYSYFVCPLLFIFLSRLSRPFHSLYSHVVNSESGEPISDPGTISSVVWLPIFTTPFRRASSLCHRQPARLFPFVFVCVFCVLVSLSACGLN